MIWRSLRVKLTVTFSVVACALVGVAALAVFELRGLESRIAMEHTTTTLFDLVREVRNRENRLFLFRKSAEFKELLESIEATSDFMNATMVWPDEPDAVAAIAELKVGLGDYRQTLIAYWRHDRLLRGPAADAEEQLRLQRRRLVDLAEDLSKNSQEAVQYGLVRHRTSLAIGITVLVLLMAAVANFLTRRILRPLKSIENQMEQVADARIDRVEFSWPDRELVSLAAAFNHVMSELETRQARAMQVEKLAALGTMLSGVAHELNNPLSNISTTVQILAEEIQHLSADEARRLLDRVDQQTERARKIVRTLLEYARADREQFRVVDALDLLHAAVDAINQGRAQSRQIMVVGPVGLLVSANAERLQRALINLIENAIGATDDADPILVVARRSALSGGAAAVDFTVQDCGTGLSAAEQARMFDPFYTTKAAGEGTGLGLFITHDIVRQHGGEIDVISIPGSGTSVSVRIPAAAEKGTSAPARPPEGGAPLPAVRMSRSDRRVVQ